MIDKLPPRYSVRERVGSGGMGQVYRAVDTRLGREVAVKLLPAELAQDRERLERLRREARVLAHIGHPNIAAIYDLEESEGNAFLILEFVPGTTLADRIARGPIPPADALPLFKQIAEAMGAAHERGVIHRDLKPANVVVSTSGRAKVLDFGIAKALDEPAEADDPWSPSGIHPGRTVTGALAGTAGYMSPEQVRGQSLDRRADIWAFGCMLYEALSGKRAFRGETVADTHAQVLERDPDWSALPADLAPRLRGLIERCLTRDPQYRARDMGDVWIELDAAQRDAAPGRPAAASARSAPHALGWTLTGALLGAAAVALVAWAVHERPTSAESVRFEVNSPDSLGALMNGPWIALSPDGRKLVYAWVNGLVERRLDDLDLRPVSRFGPYYAPFFAPDGERVGCNSPEGKMVWLSPEDTVGHAIVNGVMLRGACWGKDDSILYAGGLGGGLWKVASGGGPSRPVTTLDTTRHELTHRWPQLLPGGHAALFTIRTAEEPTFDDAEIAVVSLDTGRRWTLIRGGTCPHYLPSGEIVFARNQSLMSVPFDLANLRVTGEPSRLISGIEVAPATGAIGFDVSANGTMAYTPTDPNRDRRGLRHNDAHGNPLDDFEPAGIFEDPRFSSDGKHVVFTIVGAQNDIATYDFERRTLVRQTFDPAEDMYPVWTPNGREITFASTRSGALNLYQKPADGSRVERRLTTSPFDQRPNSWTPDGRLLFYTEYSPTTGADIWVADFSQGGACRPWLRTPHAEAKAMCSPDGRWVAYESDESGTSEIYVRPVSGVGPRWQISRGTGNEPRWSGDGRRISYGTNTGRIALVNIATEPTFRVESPSTPWPGRIYASYDLSPRDGSLICTTPFHGALQVIVTTNWLASRRASVALAR